MKLFSQLSLFKLLLIALITYSSIATAHVGLKATIPEKGAMLMASPKVLSLNYSGDVKVVKVVLKDASGDRVDFGFTPSLDSAKSFEWPLPVLKASDYTVSWIVMGADGHKMKGKFTFMVH